MSGQLVVSIAAFVVAALSFLSSRLAASRAAQAEDVKNLLGDKETVSFGAMKLMRDGFPKNPKQRALLISALMQACLLEGSDRARALLFTVVEEARDRHRDEAMVAFATLDSTFKAMDAYEFEKAELNVRKARLRLGAVAKILERSPASEERVAGAAATATG